MILPAAIAELLWSHDPTKVNPETDAKAVVLAVLRLGTIEQIEWLFAQYGTARVKAFIELDYFGDRSLPVSVRNFWGVVFWPDATPPELVDERERWRPTRGRRIEDDARSDVQARLQRALVASGFTQSAFASLLGTSQPRLSSYLTGKVVPSATFLVRAEQLGRQLGVRTDS